MFAKNFGFLSILALLLVSQATFTGCKPQKDAKTQTDSAASDREPVENSIPVEGVKEVDGLPALPGSGETEEAPVKPAKNNAIADLSVSFYSIAYGINHSAETALKNLISTFENEESVQLSVNSVRWGREGEIDYCFDLSNLSESQRENFISRTTELLTNSELVRIMQNEPCKEAPAR